MNGSGSRTVALWVIVLGVWTSAFVLANATRETRPAPTFATFLAALEAGELRRVELRTHDNSVRVTPARGLVYNVGYPPEYSTPDRGWGARGWNKLVAFSRAPKRTRTSTRLSRTRPST